MKTINGIQMIGTQRSGSNLLRVIMDQSPDVATPHPPHILVTFMPLLGMYGSLTEAENYRQLVSDVVDYVNVNPVPWEGVILNKQDIFANSTSWSLYEINRLVYEAAAMSKNAALWLCKSMANIYFASELEAHGSIKKYVYLYRDGRDVAASFKKAIVGEKHIYHLAKQWKKDQEECLQLKAIMPGDRFLSLSYEDLIHHPEKTIKQLCSFLDIGFSADMLHYYTSSASRITASSGDMWKNLEKPIMKNNTGNFLTSFQENDLEIFELVASDTLMELGYPLYTGTDNHALLAHDMIETYNKENVRLKKLKLAGAKVADMEKRKGQEDLLSKIKERVTIMVR